MTTRARRAGTRRTAPFTDPKMEALRLAGLPNYSYTGVVPLSAGLGENDPIAERLREYGSVGIAFTIEANDLWELRETLAEVEQMLGSEGIDIVIDRSNIKEVKT